MKPHYRKSCPWCGEVPEFRTVADSRSAEFVGPHRVLGCFNPTCAMKPKISMHTDGEWLPGKGTPQGINRNPALLKAWNTRTKAPRPTQKETGE